MRDVLHHLRKWHHLARGHAVSKERGGPRRWCSCGAGWERTS